MEAFFSSIPPTGRFAVVFLMPGKGLPTFHMPLRPKNKPVPSYYRLYERDGKGWRRVKLPPDRAYMTQVGRSRLAPAGK